MPAVPVAAPAYNPNDDKTNHYYLDEQKAGRERIAADLAFEKAKGKSDHAAKRLSDLQKTKMVLLRPFLRGRRQAKLNYAQESTNAEEGKLKEATEKHIALRKMSVKVDYYRREGNYTQAFINHMEKGLDGYTGKRHSMLPSDIGGLSDELRAHVKSRTRS